MCGKILDRGDGAQDRVGNVLKLSHLIQCSVSKNIARSILPAMIGKASMLMVEHVSRKEAFTTHGVNLVLLIVLFSLSSVVTSMLNLAPGKTILYIACRISIGSARKPVEGIFGDFNRGVGDSHPLRK